MGYDLHITKAEHWVEAREHPIPSQAWANLIESDAELALSSDFGASDICVGRLLGVAGVAGKADGERQSVDSVNDAECNRPGRPCYIRLMDWEPLIAAAAAARARAYAPYSCFAVGAAVLMEDGSIHAAANVENGIPALSICAERNAVAAAASAGLRKPQAVAVVTDTSPPARPCGLCRQTLVEFADDLPILVVNLQGEREETRLAEILPQPFRLQV